MVVADTLEGVINEVMWFHYDMTNDVLYIRLADRREDRTVAEETPDGFLLLRAQDDGQAVGLTVINWWKRFGTGALPDSIGELQRAIEPWADRLAA